MIPWWFSLMVSYLVCEVNCFNSEPKCSKFDYEEKLLEKMIRLEHSVGIMIDSFKEISTQVKTDLLSMKEEFGEIKQQAAEQQSSFSVVLSKFEADAQEQREEAAKVMEDEMVSFRQNVKEFKEQMKKPVYAFSATKVTDRTPPLHKPLVFSNVLLNDGDVYDITTGKFTAPANGTFAFTFSLCIARKNVLSFQIVVDGFAVSRETGYYADDIDHLSSYTVVVLTKGKKLWVEVNKTNGNGLFDTEAYCLNRFSGHIISSV